MVGVGATRAAACAGAIAPPSAAGGGQTPTPTLPPLPPTRYTAWFALQLLTSPRTAFRHVAYHRQTKLQWARDDPAFPLALGGLVCGATAAYCAT